MPVLFSDWPFSKWHAIEKSRMKLAAARIRIRQIMADPPDDDPQVLNDDYVATGKYRRRSIHRKKVHIG
jgi:hypothetical protein